MVLQWLFSKSKVSLPRNFRSSIDPEALKIVERLQKAGHQCYLVGGCVRDILLGAKPKDFDIATSATPNQVKTLVHRSFIIGRRFRIVVAKRRHTNPTGSERSDPHLLFPTPVEKLTEKEFQITTFRREPEKHNELVNENVFGSAKEDALRRDFTINALFLDPHKAELVDFVEGLKDLQQKKLKIIGDPTHRFAEDPIRILRAVRFQCRTGFQFEAKTKKALSDSIHQLKEAKRERIREEFLKAFREGHLREFLASLSSLGAWPYVSTTFAHLWEHDQKGDHYFKHLSDALAAHPWHRPVQSPLLFLAPFRMLMDRKIPDEKKLQALVEDIKVSRAEVEDIQRLFTTMKKIESDPKAEHPTRVLRPLIRYYEHDSQTFYCLMILAHCRVDHYADLWKNWKPHWEHYLQAIKNGATPAGSRREEPSPSAAGHDQPRRRRRRRKPSHS